MKTDNIEKLEKQKLDLCASSERVTENVTVQNERFGTFIKGFYALDKMLFLFKFLNNS